ncbi:MAG: SUMF1/EgtB/PvdO family nonheme iron enzyme [Prevotellaceae bacterium]|jgi:gliding motility-associated lipoprotein GldK|nr:SUMF1/EgtB/PvdO family nonheme iron enzyme [Prevotellaceae bacterium]
MKKLLYFTVTVGLVFCAYSCGRTSYGYTGELSRGTKGTNKKMKETPPFGMVYIPQGDYLIGGNDQDILWAMNAVPHGITINEFWMDQTEITNHEYRQFVSYVRDSIARALLGTNDESFFLQPEDETEELPEKRPLNWSTRINTRKNEDQRALLREMNYQGDEAINGRELDTRGLIYEYAWIDLRQAAKAHYDPVEKKYSGTVVNAKGEREEIKDRSSFILREMTYVYPDTLCWIRDFMMSYNEPFATSYFSHVAYNDYPVVGISWKQASAFCRWRTDMLQSAPRSKGILRPQEYRLPNEAEWEYAARGGLKNQLYPWGGPYTTNQEGCFLANFKPQRGRYALDGGVYTMPVGSYEPNDFGLYDMAGNVAEWVADSYDEASYNIHNDLMPTYATSPKATDHNTHKRKVVRGGSWKDISYFLQCGTRTFEYQDSTKSFIGFRCIRSYAGTAQ